MNVNPGGSEGTGGASAPRSSGVPPERRAKHDPLALGSPRVASRESGAVQAERALEPSPRVVIADRHPPTRVGIRLALEQAGFVIVAEAATGEDAASLSAAFSPDACLIDVDIPGGGIAAARTICARAPGTAVVMLSAAANEDDFVAAVFAGASGYLLKTMNPPRLPAVIRGVLEGEAAIPRSFGRRLFDEVRRRGNNAAPPLVRGREIRLTPRESQVVDLMRGGMPTREIAGRLGISDVTVRRHVSTALRKLEAPDRQAAVRLLERFPTASRGRFAR